MLKPQDCMILLKLLSGSGQRWSQRQLAEALGVSLSEINAGIKRLVGSGLLRKDKVFGVLPIVAAAEEFLINGLKYLFPGKLGEYTRGVPTGVGAPLFKDKIALGQDPIPIWPDALGSTRGVALAPIHPQVSQALRQNPDQAFYELLAIVDVIRMGRARERKIAIELLKERLADGH